VRDPRVLADLGVSRAERAMERIRPGPTGSRQPLEEILPRLGEVLGADLEALLREDGRAQIEAQVRERTAQLGDDAPFPVAYNAADSLALLCYALTRHLRPATVLETGVAYGMTSAYIAKALDLNGTGELQSVDRPPVRPGVESYIGTLVPPELRSRWTLHQGTSRRLLPRLLWELDGISLFVHDSLHTYRNIGWELRTVTPRLTRPAVVLVDDTSGNRAFEEWVERSRPAYSAVVADAPVGVAAFLTG
jgi:hypothetical protein